MQAKFVIPEDLLFFSFSWHLPGRDANPWDHSDPVLHEDFPMHSVLKIVWHAKNYTANYYIFQEHQLDSRRFPVFPRSNFKYQEISRSCRCPVTQRWHSGDLPRWGSRCRASDQRREREPSTAWWAAPEAAWMNRLEIHRTDESNDPAHLHPTHSGPLPQHNSNASNKSSKNSDKRQHQRGEKGKGSPYSITECRVPELIPVLGSQPAGDVSHKPSGRLALLSARPAVTSATLKRAANNFAAWWTEAQWVWTVCLRLLPDSVAAAIWTRALLCLSPAR